MKTRLSLSTGIVVCVLAIRLFGGEPIPVSKPVNPLAQPIEYLKYYPPHYGASLKNLFDWEFNTNLVKVSLVILPVAFLCDHSINKFAVEHGFFSDDISLIGYIYGQRWSYVAISALVGLDGWLKHQPWNKTFSQFELLGSAAVTSSLVTEILKSATHRERPNGNGYKSFPSGHASSSFTLAAGLNEIYGRKIGIPAYLMATFVASTRINDNKHYFSDVIAGALIGIWIGRGFARQHHLEWQISTSETPAISLAIPF